MSAKQKPSDSDLVTSTLNGNSEDYGKLVERYQDQIFRFSLRLTGTVTEAEDLSQEAFIRAFKYLYNFKQGYRFVTWLYAITNNLHLDRSRKKGRLKTTPLDKEFEDGDSLLSLMESPDPGPEKTILDKLADEETSQMIDSLPELYRNILLLRFVELLSYEEIGTVLDIPSGTVKTRIFRARNMLWEILVNNKGDAYEALSNAEDRSRKES